LGCTNNLAYLKSYGFKTFDQFWDESYDTDQDPVSRIQAVIKIIRDICNMSDNELQDLQNEINDIIEHNYSWFYSQTFIDNCWTELCDNLKHAIAQLPPRSYLESLPRPYLYTPHHNTNEQFQLDR
jgi:hypothetical protein